MPVEVYSRQTLDVEIQVAIDGNYRYIRTVSKKVTTRWKPTGKVVIHEGNVFYAGKVCNYAFTSSYIRSTNMPSSFYVGESLDLVCVGMSWFLVDGDIAIPIPKKSVLRNTGYVTFRGDVYSFAGTVLASSRGEVINTPINRGTIGIELIESELYIGEDFDLLRVGFDFYKVLAGCSIKIPKKEVTRSTTYVTYKGVVFKFSKVVIADSKGNIHG